MDKNWTSRAACLPHKDLYASLSHSITDRLTPDDLYRLSKAKKNCFSCPVRQECLDDALHQESYLSAPERHGIRGGLTASERVKLASGDLRCTRCTTQPRQDHGDDLRKFSPVCRSCKISMQNDPFERYQVQPGEFQAILRRLLSA
jgi:hypothetical protein